MNELEPNTATLIGQINSTEELKQKQFNNPNLIKMKKIKEQQQEKINHVIKMHLD
jgi:hypothetical protein